jgi:hypothetical protein
MKSNKKITLFSPIVIKTPKRKKGYEVKMRSRLLIVLYLLVGSGLLLIVKNTSRANTEGSQLGRSQRAIGVGDGREYRYVRKLQEWLIPLAMNDLLIAPHNLKALI